MIDMSPEIPGRLWAKVDSSGDCWEWTGAKKQGFGYGLAWFDGKLRRAHRVFYEVLVGPIPPGRDLDHLCRNQSCVNPAHLEPVSHRENVLRGVGPSARNAAKTHCKHGHPFDAANTLIRSNGHRACRTCKRANNRRWKAKAANG